MDFTKDALQYIVGLDKAELKVIFDQQYSTKNLVHIKRPSPASIGITTLTGLVDYIKSGIEGHASETLLVHVVSPTEVKVYSSLKDDANRDCYISCEAMVPSIAFGRFMDVESFNIQLQSMFILEDNAAAVLKVVGNIKEEHVKTTGDDGISQTVTAKAGIAKVADIQVPNPVTLKPFRTFQEIEQPESKFILRMKDGPQAALFEADGGAWKNEAMQTIKIFLEDELEDCKVQIIA